MAEDPRAQVARTARMLAAEGLVGAFGHVSMRLPDGGAAITSTRPMATARAVDVVVLDAAGSPVSGAVADVPLETWLHTAVYAARPDVGAICRGHPPYAVAWGTGTEELPVLHGLGLLAGATVPLHDDVALVTSAARGAAAAATLADGHALLLRGNGALAVGSTPTEAAARLLALEERAWVAVLSRAAGVAGAAPSWAERAGDSPAELRRAVRWLDHLHGPRRGPSVSREQSC